MAKPKKKPAAKKPAAKKPAVKKPAAKKPAAKKPAAKKPAATVRRSPYDEKRPDAPSAVAVAHARNLAKRVRADLELLTFSKVSSADADALDSNADTLEAAQASWLVTYDTRVIKAVSSVREPLRKGRDQIFAALRTFADGDDATQAKLDDIADVQNDDDLVSDTTRLLALARKHRADLDGTDVTPERVAEVRAALADFNAARGGDRSAASAADAQAEDETTRTARRARNRAFWTLGELARQVGKRGQYAFRDDPEKRAKYAGYRRGAVSEAATRGAEPTKDPATT